MAIILDDHMIKLNMKYSIFNTNIPINWKHTLLYNAFSGKFIVVKDKIIDISKMSIQTVRNDYPGLYDKLVEGAFIMDDSINEAQRLKECINMIDNNSNEYILHINPTLDCNFNCWYCYENHVPNSKMDTEVLNAVKLYISSILGKQEIKHLELGFFGGEPLFHFNTVAKNIITHADTVCRETNKTLHVHFTSNGALLTDDTVKFLSKLSCGFQITLDGGRESHDRTRYHKNKRGSFDDIVKNIFKLVDAKIDVIVRVNYTSSNIDGVNTISDSFRGIPADKKIYLKFDFQRVWQDRVRSIDGTEHKIALIRKSFRQQGFIVLANYIPHDVWHSCYGDKLNHLLINYNGDVYGCTARDFTKENGIGRLEPDGTIEYDIDTVAKRNDSKLSKAICQTCRIAPICGGGCKQRAVEASDSEECTFDYTENDMDNIILDIFEHSFNINS